MSMVRIVAVFAATLLAQPLLAAEAGEFFERKIRPLLVQRCYSCHSDQANKSKGGLKLDSRAALFAGGESGPAVLPGKPADSLLLKAVRRRDPQVSAMPPDQPLTEAQVKDLEQWIAEGAFYPEVQPPKEDPWRHWAFQPVRKPSVPTVRDQAWPRSDVDRFLLAKMEAAGLAPAADAEPTVVARRLAFALTGLPPTVEQLAAVQNGGPTALPRYVDQLLASPHFGERWARHWMDLVRYADSAGHEYDYEIEGAWRYRDYLVRAFNADLPFDQLIREHIAGDLLAPRIQNGRNEAILGTSWWQLQEQASAPVDLPNDEADRLDNMLDVLGKTFNALTVGCARCHDHKFDPIRTREYYGMFGIVAASPAYRTWANRPALDALAAKLRALRDRHERTLPPTPAVVVPPLSLDPQQHRLLGDFAMGIPEGWALTGSAEVVTGATAGLRNRPPGLWSDTLSRKLPSYVRSPQFIIEHDYVDVLAAGEDATVQVIVGNYQIIRAPLYDGLKKKIQSKKYQWIRVHVGRWKGRRCHVEVFTGRVHPEHRILHTLDTAQSRFGLRAVVLSDGDSPPLPQDIGDGKIASGPPAFSDRKLADEYAELERQIPPPERFIAVQDVPGTEVPVYARGDANKPRDDRPPRQYFAVARVAHPPVQTGSGRRELAEALASADNPLTARVFVNRVWHHLFGRGIVPSVDNFGRLGEPPTHPELLDYLAHRFVYEHRWRVKALIRELVLSRVYHLQSGPAPQADAANTLLTRFPLRRLEAEAIRDALLAVSGTLDRTFGGEPIPVPHQLTGTGADNGNNYPPNGPIDGQRRRSLYLASRRNFPCAFLEVFDKPSSITTFGKRDVSNVPTQALTLLNDPLVTMQAQAWAKRIAHLPLSAAQRVDRMFLEAFARKATAAEREHALALVQATSWEDLALALFNAKEFIYVP